MSLPALDEFTHRLMNNIYKEAGLTPFDIEGLLKSHKEEIFQVFEQNVSRPWFAHRFFEAFTPIDQLRFFPAKQYSLSEKMWALLIQYAKEFDSTRRNDESFRVQKGTAYYFAAVSNLLMGNIDKAFMLMHAAYEEDLQTYGKRPIEESPAYAFVSLDADNQNQYLHHYVEIVSDYLSSRIRASNKLLGRTYDIRNFRAEFIENNSIDAQSRLWFLYTIAKLENISGFRKITHGSRFTSLFLNGVLFELCKTCEFLAKKSQQKDGFRENLRYYFASKSLSQGVFDDTIVLPNETGQLINRLKDDFVQEPSRVISDIVDRNQCQALGNKERGLIVTFLLRNSQAHTFDTLELSESQYEQLTDLIFSSTILLVSDP
ncbi:MAG: hypothetical protein JRN15_10000 [Nitrososphaerota archaeon]|nr:hypothetical protein [Nitrososphaerota archaeon]